MVVSADPSGEDSGVTSGRYDLLFLVGFDEGVTFKRKRTTTEEAHSSTAEKSTQDLSFASKILIL